MRREIKFKAKRLDNGEWCEGYFYEENGNTYIIENRQKESMLNRNITHKVDPDTVCQFTGLKVRDGNGIYEGDIIDFDICLCSVVWVDSVCAFCLKNITLESTGTTPLGVMLDYNNNYRVLGSIYDSKWKEKKKHKR